MRRNLWREAIQLVWLYGILSGVDNFGRMDLYLGDFYAGDLDSGRLDEAEALRLLQGLWQLISEVFPGSGRVIIGGRASTQCRTSRPVCAGGTGSDAHRFPPAITAALLALAPRHPEAIWEKALQVISEGCSYPMVSTMTTCMCRQSPWHSACRKWMLNSILCPTVGRSISTTAPSILQMGSVSYAKLLHLTLSNGLDLFSSLPMGLATGDVTRFTSFE